jgi:hypothetical protein
MRGEKERLRERDRRWKKLKKSKTEKVKERKR